MYTSVAPTYSPPGTCTAASPPEHSQEKDNVEVYTGLRARPWAWVSRRRRAPPRTRVSGAYVQKESDSRESMTDSQEPSAGSTCAGFPLYVKASVRSRTVECP